jgi:hypothetical protein
MQMNDFFLIFEGVIFVNVFLFMCFQYFSASIQKLESRIFFLCRNKLYSSQSVLSDSLNNTRALTKHRPRTGAPKIDHTHAEEPLTTSRHTFSSKFKRTIIYLQHNLQECSFMGAFKRHTSTIRLWNTSTIKIEAQTHFSILGRSQMDCLLELQRRTHTFLLFIDLPFWKVRKCEQLGKGRPHLYQTQKSIAITLFLNDATCENNFCDKRLCNAKIWNKNKTIVLFDFIDSDFNVTQSRHYLCSLTSLVHYLNTTQSALWARHANISQDYDAIAACCKP